MIIWRAKLRRLAAGERQDSCRCERRAKDFMKVAIGSPRQEIFIESSLCRKGRLSSRVAYLNFSWSKAGELLIRGKSTLVLKIAEIHLKVSFTVQGRELMESAGQGSEEVFWWRKSFGQRSEKSFWFGESSISGSEEINTDWTGTCHAPTAWRKILDFESWSGASWSRLYLAGDFPAVSGRLQISDSDERVEDSSQMMLDFFPTTIERGPFMKGKEICRDCCRVR